MSNNRAVALQSFQGVIADRQKDIRSALPAHIPAERFERVVMTAIQNNLQLLDAPPRELFNACIKAAQDGLLPDGREGALIARPSRNGTSVTWQPMIAGIRKKVRNSGEISTWDVVAVYQNDKFEYELGDNPFIRHKPALKDRGELIAVYSVATLKGGEKSRDVMSIEDVNAIRDRSDAWRAHKSGKIKSTPWSTDPAEMAKKTVAKRHSKVLPMSTDLDDLMRRDDDLYDFKGAGDAARENAPARRPGIAAKLDAITLPKAGEGVTIDADTGEVHDGSADDVLAEHAANILDGLDHSPRGIDTSDDRQVIAYADGCDAASSGSDDAAPSNLSAAEAAAWRAGYAHTIAAGEEAA